MDPRTLPVLNQPMFGAMLPPLSKRVGGPSCAMPSVCGTLPCFNQVHPQGTFQASSTMSSTAGGVNNPSFHGPHLTPFAAVQPASGLWPNLPLAHQQSSIPIPATNFVNVAFQTALLLAKLHQQTSNQPDKRPSSVPPRREDTIVATPVVSKLKVDVPCSPSNSVSRKRASVARCEDSRKLAKMGSSDGATESDDSGSERESKPTGLRGERRLVITFDSLGHRGACPQTFGKSGAIVPDGVVGSHTVYNERWKFGIHHTKEVFQVENLKCVCITWTVTNLNTGHVTSLTESREEAIIRNSQGQTISNKVFREALEARAKDLEKSLINETNVKKCAQVQSLIRNLRPKRFSEGPLVFGLQHKVVQDKMIE